MNQSLDRMDQKGMSGLPYQVEFMNSVILIYKRKRSEDLENKELKKEVLPFHTSKTLEILSIIKIVSTRMITFLDVVDEGKFRSWSYDAKTSPGFNLVISIK